jgi:hypothetical protein
MGGLQVRLPHYCHNFLDSPNLQGQAPIFISFRDMVAQL